jgi:fatty acid synthase subunit alpha, fungi type
MRTRRRILVLEAAEVEVAPVAIPTPAAAVLIPVSVAPPGGAVAIEDVPLKALDILVVIVAQKLKKKVDEISLSKSIKDLVGGIAPEKGEELPLDELGSALGSAHSGSLGKYTNGMVSRMVSSKLPGGFNASAVKAYLSKSWGLGPSRVDGVLLLATTMEPAKRIGSEPEAKT